MLFQLGTALRLADDPAACWFELIRLDYLGLCYYQMAEVTRAQKRSDPLQYLKSAEGVTESALNLLQNTHQARQGNHPIVHLWRGYILRNLGRIRAALGDAKAAADLCAEAITERKTALNGLMAEHVGKVILDQVAFEIQLSELDALELAPESAPDLLHTVAEGLFRRQGNWIGLWNRAFTQAIRVAQKRGLGGLAHRLSQRLLGLPG